jgi:hypothetical protein
MKTIILLTGIWFVLQIFAATAQDVIFEDNCQSLKQWQFLDAKGDGKIKILEDFSVPPGFGPKVIEMSGTNVLLFAKAPNLADGTLVALWKDVVPNQLDADGLLLFRADYPDDLAELHNVKKNLPHYWLEQDFDAGFQLKYDNERDEQVTLLERPGVGLVQDETWNQTGWFWQKVKFSGNQIYAKFWSVVAPEPEEWMLITAHSARLSGRFGLRAWSGRARIAFFKASHHDISVPLPVASLHADFPQSFEGQPIQLKAFVNFPTAFSTARWELKILQGKKLLSQENYEISISTGFRRLPLPLETTRPNESPAFVLATPLKTGDYLFQMEIFANDELLATASQKINIQPARDFEARFAALENEIGKMNQELAPTTAREFLNLAREKWQSRDAETAWRALEHAQNALNRVNQPVNGPLKINNFQMKFVDVHLTRETWQFGQTDTVTIFWQISGEKPTRNFSVHLKLVDKYNHPILNQSAAPIPPTSQWVPGKIYPQQFIISVPHQIEPNAEKSVEMPPLFTGWHLLTVSVSDPAATSQNRNLLLAQPERMDFFPVGTAYTLRNIYVSPEALQIQSVELPATGVGQAAEIQIKIGNTASQSLPAQVYLKLTSETGRIIFEDGASLNLPPRQTGAVTFNWNVDFAGKLNCAVGIIRDQQIVNEMQREWEIKWPTGLAVQLQRGNQVQQIQGEFSVPLQVEIKHPTGARCPRSVTLEILAEPSSFQQTFSCDPTQKSESFQIQTWPHWGYFDFHGKISGTETFDFAERIVATVVETRDRQIFVNGEPFTMKGVNVHAVYSRSERLTDQTLKILKEQGFNTLRGDFPARWQVALAEENNLAWMLLAEYSCTHTDSIAARYETEMFGAAQEIVKNYLLANARQASAVFWNSCNEIDGELDAFLLNLYPVFKQFDPYQRPVNYANLYGQDNWRGQDIMGVNYYYGIGQTTLSRQPIIKNSGRIAREHGLPMIFTEYNCFWGPVEKAGAEAVAVMWAENLKDCLSGGTLYQLRDDPAHHPGVLDAHGQLEVRQTMSQALKKHFADLQLESANRDAQHLQIKLTNVRPFTLRKIQLEARIRNHTEKFQLATEITPFKSVHATLTLPDEFSNETVLLDCTVAFETHFGLKNQVTGQLIFLHPKTEKK